MPDDHDNDGGGIVIQFPGQPTGGAELKPRRYEKGEPPPCQSHQAVYVHESTRTVTCKRCGKTLDSFDVLMDYAKKIRVYHATTEATRDARDQLSELQAEIKKAKAKLAKVSARESKTAVETERKRIASRAYDLHQKADEIERAARQMRRLSAQMAGVRPLKLCESCTLAGHSTCGHLTYPTTKVWGGDA